MTETNEAVSTQLERVLATSYTLYLKTHNFHWNVTGPMFATFVADQQTIVALARDLLDAADEIDDQATADRATRRLNVHEKHAWMLRSHLE